MRCGLHRLSPEHQSSECHAEIKATRGLSRKDFKDQWSFVRDEERDWTRRRGSSWRFPLWGEARYVSSIPIALEYSLTIIADVLVQLVIEPEGSGPDSTSTDAWDNIVSTLESLGSGSDQDESRYSSIEEVPIIRGSLSYGDVLREGVVQNSPRPTLLAITMLPPTPKSKQSKPGSPPIPPHHSIIQRRMELLTSDMLTRALSLVQKGKHEQAHATLRETRSILKGLGKGGLPPVPGQAGARLIAGSSVSSASGHSSAPSDTTDRRPSPPPVHPAVATATGIDTAIMAALDSELESALEWINHPAVFSRDSRKAVLEKIGVISSQRAYTFRTALDTMYAGRIPGIRMLYDESRNWPEAIDESLTEENI